jgi:hypothetical protein
MSKRIAQLSVSVGNPVVVVVIPAVSQAIWLATVLPLMPDHRLCEAADVVDTEEATEAGSSTALVRLLATSVVGPITTRATVRHRPSNAMRAANW